MLYLQTPAADGGVIRGAGNNGAVEVDCQICHLSVMPSAGPQQLCSLSAPDLCSTDWLIGNLHLTR